MEEINRVEISPPPITLPQKPAAVPPPISQPTISQPTDTRIQNTPVMLYQKQEQKPLAATMKTQIKGEMTADTKPDIKPTAARVEIGPEAETLTSGNKKEPVIAKTPQPEFPKLVHYTDFKTPVNNQGQTAVPTAPADAKLETAPTEEVVDLNSFEPVKKIESQPAPTNGQPRVDGNILNLK